MKKILFAISFAFIISSIHAQNNPDTSINTADSIDREALKIYDSVDTPASFKGGISQWQRFLVKNLRYPEKAIERSAQGKVVLDFIVDTLGRVSNITVVEEPGSDLGKEGERIIRLTDGKWEPGILQGRKVTSHKIQPIVFRLSVR